MKPEHVRHPGLSKLLKDAGVELPNGISGFQWGWAVNASRYCVELPPASNPAILTVQA